jgi:hypothetical protein
MQLRPIPAVLAAGLFSLAAGCSSCCHKQAACAPPLPRVTAAPPCCGPGPCPAPCPPPCPGGAPAAVVPAVPAAPVPAVEGAAPAPPASIPSYAQPAPSVYGH